MCIRDSWNKTSKLQEGNSLAKGDALLQLRFKTRTTTQLDKVLSLADETIIGEAVDQNADTKGFELTFIDKVVLPSLDFKLFPNPLKRNLTVVMTTQLAQESQLSLVDNFGREVLSLTVSELQTTINVQHLPTGIYYIKIDHLGQSVTKRFTKVE